MSEATTTFDGDVEQLIREIARDEIKKYFGDKLKAFVATGLANMAKAQPKTASKPAAGITNAQLVEAIKAAIAKRQAQQGPQV
jgi:uncharacterized Zn finger protein